MGKICTIISRNWLFCEWEPNFPEPMLKNLLFIRHAQILKKIKDDFNGYGIGRGYTHYFLKG